MAKNILLLPSGTEINSGTNGNAIMEIQLTEAVNGNNDLVPGVAVASCLEAVIWVEDEDAIVKSGDELVLFKVLSDGTRKQQGIYVAEKPTRKSANTYSITAYDNVSKLDKSLSSWISTIQDRFPMSQTELANEIANQCGIEIENLIDLPCRDYKVRSFYADNLTGRTILSWIAESNCRYITALSNGKIQFGWYGLEEDTSAIAINEYYQGGLTYDDFQCPVIDTVRIRQSDSDIGVLYPVRDNPLNTMVVQGNLILANADTEVLMSVAEIIYTQMRNVTAYIPCKISMPENTSVFLGERINVSVADGKTIASYVMKKTVKAGKMTLECFGTSSRSSSSAVNNVSLQNVAGRMFELSMSVDGLKTQASDLDKNVTLLQQTSGQVKVEAKSEQGTLSTVISNDGTWKTVYTDVNGQELSGIAFDFLEKEFKFNGSGSFTGELDIGKGNFTVDVNGNVTAHGDTKIYGGKYYAMDEYASNYTMMDDDGFTVYSGDAVERVKVGFPPNSPENPYVVLNGGTLTSASRIIMKQFTDGMWLGNDAPINASGEFIPQEGYNGIFISLSDKQTYVVAGEDMQSIYTGTSIARFG